MSMKINNIVLNSFFFLSLQILLSSAFGSPMGTEKNSGANAAAPLKKMAIKSNEHKEFKSVFFHEGNLTIGLKVILTARNGMATQTSAVAAIADYDANQKKIISLNKITEPIYGDILAAIPIEKNIYFVVSREPDTTQASIDFQIYDFKLNKGKSKGSFECPTPLGFSVADNMIHLNCEIVGPKGKGPIEKKMSHKIESALPGFAVSPVKVPSIESTWVIGKTKKVARIIEPNEAAQIIEIAENGNSGKTEMRLQAQDF